MSSRITVDRTGCDGRGVCAELFPEVITLDDWGYPIVASGIVPLLLLPQARQAVSSCPVLALRLISDHRESATLTAKTQPRVTEL